MQLSRNWLADYVELPQDVDELSRRLTAAGHAVEKVEQLEDSGAGDTVLDVDITTNRSDCMNHFGLAREIAVIFGKPLNPPAMEVQEAAEPASSAARIEIETPELCRRYVGRVIRGVKVGQSPDWLVRRLETIGVRTINNVVDVTNYVLWEYGQPLHAFDLEALDGAMIRVRPARSGEELVTLDGETRKLDPEMLVIADASRPVALAGVMGGLDSEVTDATTDVLLESAYFHPSSVRRTAGRLGMHTDASHRFERGADPGICAVAATRAAALIAELAGGTVLAGEVDAYPSPPETRTISLDLARLQAFAGAAIPRESVVRWLEGLGCTLKAEGTLETGAASRWQVTIPSWRHGDLELTADLYEEAVRLYGFDAIEASLPALSGHDGHPSRSHLRATRLRRNLAAQGYAEAVTFAFHDAESDRRHPGLLGSFGPLKLENALSERYGVMRRSLLPNLLETAAFNQRRGLPAVRFFEVGHVFGARSSGEGTEGVEEIETVALVAGGRLGHAWDAGPQAKARELDFFDLKGAVESLAATFRVSLEMRPQERTDLVAGCAAEIFRVGQEGAEAVGYAGQLANADGPYPLYVAELATQVLAAGDDGGAIEVPSRFPGINVDLTLTHSLETPWAEIAAAVEALALQDLAAFGLKDRYQGKGVAEGAVNTTVYFEFSSTEGSLTHGDVNERLTATQEHLEGRFGWKSS